MLEHDLRLFALFAIVAASILFRVSVESTGYRSPDSMAILEVAQNIVDNKGFIYLTASLSSTNVAKYQTYFALWPLGYPVLIAGFSLLFSLPVFWASKLVNLFFLGLCFLIFRKINKEYSYVLSMIMCSFTFLEVFSYTWSEGPFLFGLLWFGYTLHQFLQGRNRVSVLIQLFLSCLFMFLLRYVGGFSFMVLGLISVKLIVQKKYKLGTEMLFLSLILTLIAGLYFYNNYLQTGSLTGGERFFPDKENLSTFLWLLFIGIFNEFFIIRNYYWKEDYPDLLFLATASFQILLMLFIYLKYLKEDFIKNYFINSLSTLYGIIGLFYIITLISIRAFSPFDPFDYRLLSPFSLCIYTSVIISLIQHKKSKNLVGSYKYISALFAASLVLNLPKTYLLEAFQSLISKIIL